MVQIARDFVISVAKFNQTINNDEAFRYNSMKLPNLRKVFFSILLDLLKSYSLHSYNET